jgi:hypothetical protein
MQIPGISNLERRHHRLISRRRFANRMLKAIALWFIFAFVGLTIGMAGYAAFEHMSLADAYVNAAMILSGMGPTGRAENHGWKNLCRVLCDLLGLLIVIATGFVLALLFQRLLHHFHVETDRRD